MDLVSNIFLSLLDFNEYLTDLWINIAIKIYIIDIKNKNDNVILERSYNIIQKKPVIITITIAEAAMSIFALFSQLLLKILRFP